MELHRILDYLNEYSGAITCIITFIYVCATIIICWANIKSSNASKKQLMEVKRQYEDDKKMKLMPCIQVKKLNIYGEYNGIISYTIQHEENSNTWVTAAFPFEITNVGNGIARYVEYYWGNQNNVDDCHFRYQITSLPVGDSRVAIVLFKSHSANYHTTASATITYHDLVGNHYFPHLNICLSISKERISLDTYTIEAPIMYFEE